MRYKPSLLALLLALGVYGVSPILLQSTPLGATPALADSHSGSGGGDDDSAGDHSGSGDGDDDSGDDDGDDDSAGSTDDDGTADQGSGDCAASDFACRAAHQSEGSD